MTKLTFADKQKTLFARKKSLIDLATPSELRVKRLLDDLQIRYMFQKGFINGNFYCIVDFYLPKLKICIEVDGMYHASPEQQIKDKRKDSYLTKDRGFRMIRITNEATEIMTLETLSSLLKTKQ